MGNECQRTNKLKALVESLGQSAWSALQNGDLSTAEREYVQAIEVAKSLADEACAVFFSYLGVAHQGLGRSDQACQDFLEAKRIAGDHGLSQIEAHANLLLGEHERDCGHLDEATVHFLNALDSADRANDDVAIEMSLGNLGRLYLERGFAEQASEWFGHALEARNSTPNRSSWLGSLGLAMAELGQFDSAIKYYASAFEEALSNNDQVTQSICKGSEGNALFELNRYADAVERYRDAVRLAKDSHDFRRLGIWLGNIGTTHLKLGHADTAIQFCSMAVQIAREQGDRQSEAAHLDSMGDCMRAQGDLEDQALEYYQSALELSEDIEDRQGERIYLSNIGKIYEAKEQFKPAFECYQKAIELFDLQRSSIKADDLKTSFANRGHDLYRDMVKICLTMDKRVQALEYVGRAKSRALLDLLSNSPIDISQISVGDDASLARLIKRESELRSLISSFERLFWQGGAEGDGSHRRARQAQENPKQLYAEWRDVVNQLRRRHPDYAGLITATTLNFDEIKALWETNKEQSASTTLLGKNTAIIEFYLTDEYLMSAGIWSEKTDPTVHLLANESELDSFNVDLGSFLEMAATEGWSVPPSLCKRLYKHLIAPVIADLPADITKLLIVPHGILYHLPFAALHDGNGFLCERFAISYVPATSLIPILARSGDATVHADTKYLVSAISDYSATRHDGLVLSSRMRSAAGLDDLSHTMEEAQTVYEIGIQTSAGSKLLRNKEVKEALPELFSQYSVIHFAGHAVFNAEEPLASGLVLADGSILSAASILQSNILRTKCGKLLVLSACQTGVNMITEGGEILGLARALMYAGMPNLVLSLWEVADRSTASLMQVFHEQLLAKADGSTALRIGDALREAQRHAARSGQPIHSWAPFIHLGID